jgi:N-acetylmuramoyl-L-alanine amidase
MILPPKTVLKQGRRASMNAGVDRPAPPARFDRRRRGMLALCVWFAVLPCAPAVAETPPPADCDRAAFRMIIDVGHTETKYGAVSAHGKPEYDFNRRLAQELASRFWADGFERTEVVIQTDPDLARRARDLSSRKPDLMLSLHHDSVQDKFLKTGELDGQIRTYTEGFLGYSIFVSRDNAFLDDSERFAKMLGGELLAQGLKPTFHHHEQENRPIYDPESGVFFFDLLVVLRQTTAPAVLLESAVVTNPEDEAKADDPAYRNKITNAIVSAVVNFCESRAPAPPKPVSPEKSGSHK